MGLLVICMRESCVERPKPGIDRDVLATLDRHGSCSDRARPLGEGGLYWVRLFAWRPQELLEHALEKWLEML
jgi:hypothetical protein